MASDRDLLVMFRQYALSEKDMEKQVTQLNKLLFNAERLDNFVNAHEVLDINRYKIINNPVAIKKMIRQGKFNKPFVFFSNKN